jgi:2-methylcitrate dehydratase PrpD
MPSEPKTAPAGATQQLCERINQVSFDDFDEKILTCARQLFLDGVAVAVAGTAQEEPPKLLAEQAKVYGGEPQASVIGFGFKASLYQAALINGAAMHVLDYEAMWMPVNHQLSTSLPAILALAEFNGYSGREVVTAFIKGTEMMGRMRQASKEFNIRIAKFHPPGIVGPLGAVVASAHLLGLTTDQLRHALSVVSSRAGGLWPNNGTDTKSTHCGLASANGLDAALLAQRGFTGNPEFLEWSRGFVETYFELETFDWDHLLDFSNPYRMIDPGYAIKMFPSQYATHFIIDASLGVREKVADHSQLEELILHAPRIDYIDRPEPATGLAGKFSFQYVAACSWLDGEITMDSFTDERRFSPDMVEMLKKVRLNNREDISPILGERFVEVEAVLRNGPSELVRSDGPPGCFGRPKITTEKHLEKVRSCLALRLSPSQIEQVIDYGNHLETLSGDDIKELMGTLVTE